MSTFGEKSRILLYASVAIWTVACSSENGSPGRQSRQGTGHVSTDALPPADQVVAANAAAESSFHLVARVYLNDRTEVAEFYEPRAGQIMFSMAGQPKDHTILRPNQVLGQSPAAIWDEIAPGQPMPDTLAQAIGRSQSTAASAAVSSVAGAVEGNPVGGGTVPNTDRTTNRSGVQTNAAGERVATTSSALTSGYCGTQWLSDFALPNNDPTNQTPEKSYGKENFEWQSLDRTGNEYYYTNPGIGFYFNVCSEINTSTLYLQNPSNPASSGCPNGHCLQVAYSPFISGSFDVAANYYRWAAHSMPAQCDWGNCGGYPGCADCLTCGPCALQDQQAVVDTNGNATYNWEGELFWQF